MSGLDPADRMAPRRSLLTNTQFCVAVGLVLGAVIAFGGFKEFLVVVALGAAGYVVAKIADGSIDVSGLTGRNRR